jgi:predicted TIM-barrel fold metal-dependent hydrolase
MRVRFANCDCRKGQCTTEEWEKCERRLRKAGGELMPPPTGGKPADPPMFR